MTDPERTSILVVDDLPEKILAYRAILEDEGLDLVAAGSGEEALREVLRREFAVILLDVNMPGMNGLETASLIRKRRRSAHTPVIFLTAFSDDVHAAQGYAHGAVDYIPTPVVPEVLRAKVRVFVDLYRMTQQVRRQAEERVALAEERSRREAAEGANRRLAFLADASHALSGSLDPEATAAALARLVVPTLADVAGLTLAGDPGRPWKTKLAWAAPGSAEVRAMWVSAPEGPDDDLRATVDRVLATGKPEQLAGLEVPFPAPAGEPPADARIRSAAVLPLQARDRTLGALTLAFAADRPLAAADLVLAQDLAARAAVAFDNARLYHEVRQADRQKNEFLSMLAHELRNPLAPIRNAVEVMRIRAPMQPELVWARDVIDRQVRHMTRLVDDLLDVSRITQGKIQLKPEPIDLGAIAAQAVEASRPVIDARRHRLTVDAAAVRVTGDAARLTQVFTNLLNNAAKYTEEGGEIALVVGREGADAVVRVRDTGLGIPPEMLGSVFELFTQIDRSLDRSQGGLGVGLTLVKRLVELHGGTVAANSEGVGRGSEFVVRLPAAAGPARPSGGVPAAAATRPVPVG